MSCIWLKLHELKELVYLPYIFNYTILGRYHSSCCRALVVIHQCSIMMWVFVFGTSSLVFVNVVTGNNHCVATKGVVQHGSVSHYGIILRQIAPIGLKLCINTCDTTGGCTHINYNWRDLRCDLMAGTVGGNEDSDNASHMSSANLEAEPKVGTYKVSCKYYVHQLTVEFC